MAFGFPAYFTESRIFNLAQDELMNDVKAALDSLGWRYRFLSATELEASISISLSSWGERLKIEFLPGGVLKVKSKCVYPLQCFDWGKNRDNVQTFFAKLLRLKELRESIGAPERTPVVFDERGLSPIERVITESKKI